VYTSLDYAQTGLIAAVFFFKVSMVFPSTMLCPLVSNNNLKKIISIVEFLNTFNQRKKNHYDMLCCQCYHLQFVMCFYARHCRIRDL
jgi:hypothetical protein